MFEEVYKYYDKEINDYKFVFKHATWLEIFVLVASFLLSLLALKIGFVFLLVWAFQFVMVLSFIFRRIIKRKYGSKVEGIIDCPELAQMKTEQFRSYLSKVKLIDLNKLDKLNQMIENELKGQYVVEIAIPTGAAAVLMIIFSHYVGWIFTNCAGKDFLEASRIFLSLSFIVGMLYLYFAVLFYSIVQGLQIRQRNLKSLKKEIDNIILGL